MSWASSAPAAGPLFSFQLPDYAPSDVALFGLYGPELMLVTELTTIQNINYFETICRSYPNGHQLENRIDRIGAFGYSEGSAVVAMQAGDPETPYQAVALMGPVAQPGELMGSFFGGPEAFEAYYEAERRALEARQSEELAQRELELARALQRRLLPPATGAGAGYRIAARNLALAFPELDEAERTRLLRRHFH